MSQPGSPQQDPVTLTAVLGALKATTDELKATKGEVTALKDEAQYLRNYGRHNRVFVLIDVLLTVLVTAVGYLSVHAASQSSAASTLAQQNHAAQVITCQASNQARAQNEQLWAFVITLLTSTPPRAGETAAQKAAGQRIVTQLRGKVETTFMPRNCQQLSNGKKP